MPPAPTLLHEYFERSARVHPTALALCHPSPEAATDGPAQLTYQELDRRANALGATLTKEIQPDEIVAIAISRERPEAYVALLAVLKAGAAYTYLDPSFPTERQARIVADAGVRTILCAPETVARDFPGVSLLSWQDWPDQAEQPFPAGTQATPQNLAYVIYTSGTTGEPKGVLIEHRSICNLIESDIETFALGSQDRIAQGSSLAYDSSVEEIWMAWSVGAAVVVMHDDTVRLGPDLVPWLKDQRISVVCPTPTLLRTMGTLDPAIDLPDLELIYIGGEALTPDLVQLWSKSKWLENGYGPTECTVTVVRGRMRAGQAITIGKPIAGNEALIVDADGRLLENGQAGELCLRGASLARGYHNRPELNAIKFEQHPGLGRIYHTGDWVKRDDDGNLHFLGRIDSQIKLRGYRIELQEIELRLQAIDGIRESACAVVGEGAAAVLIALAVSEHSTPGTKVLDPLREQVPEYMVPARLFWVAELPTNVSGKLDRKAAAARALELQTQARSGAAPTCEAPSSDLEKRLAQAMARSLPPGSSPGLLADFFLDLGGDSLAAATLVSDLRGSPETSALAVRHVYELRTVEAMAEFLQAHEPTAHKAGAVAQPQRPPASSLNPTWATLFQTIWLAGSLIVGLATLYGLALWALPKVLLHFGLWPTLGVLALLGPLLPWLWLMPSILLTICAKRCLIGKYEAGAVPAWSAKYVRHWLVQRISATLPWGLLQGTVWHADVLRALGAKIGRNVHLHRGVSFPLGGWDLLELGDDVTLCQDAGVRPVEWHAGHLMFDRISIGDGCTVGIRAGLSPGATMEPGSMLAEHAWLPGEARARRDQTWAGIPAQAAGPAPEKPPTQGAELGPLQHAVTYMLARAALSYALALPWLLALAGFLWFGEWSAQGVVNWLYGKPLADAAAWAAIATLLVPTGLVLRAWAMRCMGPVAAGTYPLRSTTAIKAWIKAEQVERAGLWISGSLFWPSWLRAAGMQVGRNSEISTIIDCVPERVSIGAETFFADGIYLAPPILHRGTLTVADTSIGERTFIGNHSVIPSGHRMPNDLLLGVCTVADENRMPEGTSWFGNPCFELPRRQVVEMERALTHDPGTLRYIRRALWEGARSLLPALPMVLGLAWFQWTSQVMRAADLGARAMLTYSGITLGLACILPTFVLAIKWVLLGRVKPAQHGLWSGWCCRWDFLYVTWNLYARPLLATLEGTTLLAWYLRAMGSKIGKRVVLGGAFAQVVDPDMLNFEDGSTVSGIFQAHTFEDRVLKIAPLKLRKDCTLAASALMFYGADVGRGCHISPQSVIMKEEHLTAHLSYSGSPSQPAGN